MKNILLATTGTSPQVLTETLYAIHQSGRPFPNEVFVITTRGAKSSLMNGLFRDGHLAALKSEYDLPEFVFDESHIWLIEDEQGNDIDDAKSIEDQTSMADFITRKVFELTQDENCTIHASLAGGRKTMAFYFGYAMSMFGREQDVLSHVFVDDDFEFVRDFWFPTKQSKWVTGKNGQGELDTSLATITLAEIPFVRMRKSLDSSLVSAMANYSFSQTVAMLNASHNDQLDVVISKPSLLISLLGIDIKLTAKEMACYLWILDKGQTGLIVDRDFSDNTLFSREFLCFYSDLKLDPRVYQSFNTTPEDFREGDFASMCGMSRDFLQPLCSTINHKLKKALPKDISSKLLIESHSEGTDHYYRVALTRLSHQATIVE
jgi:CRISPR-associated protein (TIGR02584 family)